MARVGEAFRPAIPNGCQIYAARLLGLLLSSRAELGYVPKDIAEALVTNALLPSVSPRLKFVSGGDDGRVDIEFDIVGPKEQKKTFDAFFEKKLSDRPASGEQRELAWFFSIKLSKRATLGQAKSEIDLRRSSVEREAPASFLEWEALWQHVLHRVSWMLIWVSAFCICGTWRPWLQRHAALAPKASAAHKWRGRDETRRQGGHKSRVAAGYDWRVTTFSATIALPTTSPAVCPRHPGRPTGTVQPGALQ